MPADDLPVGKLPANLLEGLLARLPTHGPQVLLGPGVGLDCAVVESSGRLLVFKSDPITFASDAIGWYAVQVNANDLATTGALPRWLLVTLLLPTHHALPLLDQIGAQLEQACTQLGIVVIGGHTEVSYGLDRPILVGTMIGEVSPECLITPRGAQPGDRLLLTKGVPIEATALLSRELPARLSNPHSGLSATELATAQAFLRDPGLSVLTDAQIAIHAGKVHAMHDPTEGGLYTALWELAQACQHTLWVDPSAVPVYPLSAHICQILDLDPLGAIASGALLLAAPPPDARNIAQALVQAGIPCQEIGLVADQPGPPLVRQGFSPEAGLLPRPSRDEIARIFESSN
jgi:hydrogenase expression/formation protein HypE